MELVFEHQRKVFEDAFMSSNNTIKIISPYIEKSAADVLINKIKEKPDLKCILITKFADDDFLSGASNLDVLKKLLDCGVQIKAVANLHTKLYLFDNDKAIFGSANFTGSGFDKNVELSAVLTDEIEKIQELHKYFEMIYKKSKTHDININAVNDKFSELKTDLEQAKQKNKKAGKTFGAFINVNQINKSDDLRSVLKFEYTDNYNQVYKPNIVNGFYFTSSPKNPRMLTSDKLLFMTVILENSSSDIGPVIIGRTRTYGFCKNNTADQDMIYHYPATEHFSKYVKLYNLEILNAPISEGIPLYDVIAKFGLNTYPSTKAKDPYKAYMQQSYREISQAAKDYINDELDKKIKKFGMLNNLE